jgi:hypothetical protein
LDVSIPRGGLGAATRILVSIHRRGVVPYPHGETMRDFHLPTDLDDYRTAYRGYLLDPDLQG